MNDDDDSVQVAVTRLQAHEREGLARRIFERAVVETVTSTNDATAYRTMAGRCFAAADAFATVARERMRQRAK